VLLLHQGGAFVSYRPPYTFKCPCGSHSIFLKLSEMFLNCHRGLSLVENIRHSLLLVVVMLSSIMSIASCQTGSSKRYCFSPVNFRDNMHNATAPQCNMERNRRHWSCCLFWCLFFENKFGRHYFNKKNGADKINHLIIFY